MSMLEKLLECLRPVQKPEKVFPKMLMVTTEKIEGKKIIEVKGLVCGWQPRCNFRYSFEDVRDRALVSMESQCCDLGGNAIIGLRFDSDIAGNTAFVSQVYGTAVLVEDA